MNNNYLKKFCELKRKYREPLRDPLFRNSFFLIVGRFIDAGFGFIFWILAARFFSVTDVGIATALVSSQGLVIILSRFGFDITLIRYMPSYDQSKVFNSCLWITSASTAVVSIIYLLTIDFFSPEIAFIKDYYQFFLLFAILNSITLITANALLALRRANLRLIQNIIMGSRIFLLYPFINFGSMGIFFAFGITYILATVFALVIMRNYVRLSATIDKKFIRDNIHFSSMNYYSGILNTIPSLILPILVVNIIGPDGASLYYISFAIGNLILAIPDALGTSLFVEGSHGINLRKGAKKTIFAAYLTIVPLTIFIYFFGDSFLRLYGEDYLAAFNLLKVIAISGLFVFIYNLFITLQTIRLKVRGVVFLSLIRFILLFGLNYTFLFYYGVIGTGYAWIITYFVLVLFTIIISVREGLITSPHH